MSKTIEYKDHKFHLGFNDGSRESLMKFLNDEQILHNGQIVSISTSKISDEIITSAIKKVFDMRPGMIIRDLKLLRPIYKKTACYGHFGRDDPDFTWEKTDKIVEFKKAVTN